MLSVCARSVRVLSVCVLSVCRLCADCVLIGLMCSVLQCASGSDQVKQSVSPCTHRGENVKYGMSMGRLLPSMGHLSPRNPLTHQVSKSSTTRSPAVKFQTFHGNARVDTRR